MDSILKSDQLRDIFGCKQDAKLRELLENNNINYFLDIHGKPWTTLEAVNSRLIESNGNRKTYRFA